MGRGQSMASVVGMTWVTGPASTDQLCVLGEVPGPLCADFLIQKVGITTVPMTPAVLRTGGPVKSLPQHLAYSPAQAPCPGPLLSGLRRDQSRIGCHTFTPLGAPPAPLPTGTLQLWTGRPQAASVQPPRPAQTAHRCPRQGNGDPQWQMTLYPTCPVWAESVHYRQMPSPTCEGGMRQLPSSAVPCPGAHPGGLGNTSKSL